MLAFAAGVLSGLKNAAGYRDHDDDEDDLGSWITQVDREMNAPCRRGLEPKLREDSFSSQSLKVCPCRPARLSVGIAGS